MKLLEQVEKIIVEGKNLQEEVVKKNVLLLEYEEKLSGLKTKIDLQEKMIREKDK